MPNGVTTRSIQQLRYDGKRLFYPEHPDRELEETVTNDKLRPFAMVCMAPVPSPIPGEIGACMNSAEWQDREEMIKELRGVLHRGEEFVTLLGDGRGVCADKIQ